MGIFLEYSFPAVSVKVPAGDRQQCQFRITEEVIYKEANCEQGYGWSMGKPQRSIQKPRSSSSRATTLLEFYGTRGAVSSQDQEKESCAELGCFEEKKQTDQGHVAGMELGE